MKMEKEYIENFTKAISDFIANKNFGELPYVFTKALCLNIGIAESMFDVFDAFNTLLVNIEDIEKNNGSKEGNISPTKFCAMLTRELLAEKTLIICDFLGEYKDIIHKADPKFYAKFKTYVEMLKEIIKIKLAEKFVKKYPKLL